MTFSKWKKKHAVVFSKPMVSKLYNYTRLTLMLAVFHDPPNIYMGGENFHSWQFSALTGINSSVISSFISSDYGFSSIGTMNLFLLRHDFVIVRLRFHTFYCIFLFYWLINLRPTKTSLVTHSLGYRCCNLLFSQIFRHFSKKNFHKRIY